MDRERGGREIDEAQPPPPEIDRYRDGWI